MLVFLGVVNVVALSDSYSEDVDDVSELEADPDPLSLWLEVLDILSFIVGVFTLVSSAVEFGWDEFSVVLRGSVNIVSRRRGWYESVLEGGVRVCSCVKSR